MSNLVFGLSATELATAIAAFSALISVVMVLMTIVYQRHRVDYAAKTLDVQQTARAGAGFFNIVTSQYLDRHFSAATPPKVGGKVVERMRDLKGRAKKDLIADPVKWAMVSTDMEKRGWENVLAYELAIALNRIGIAVLTGVVPAGFFVTIAADQVLDDWMLCRDWIYNYREQESTKVQSIGAHFHRRHAEWLFLLSALWMQRNFPNYPSLAGACRNRSHLKEDFVALTMIEPSLMPPWVKAEIVDMLALDPSELGLSTGRWSILRRPRSWFGYIRKTAPQQYRGEANPSLHRTASGSR